MESEKPQISRRHPNPELNVTSEQFNALKVLYEPNMRFTNRKPKVIYQNMAAFESALRRFGIENLNKRNNEISGSGKKGIEPKLTFRRFEKHQLPIVCPPKIKDKHQRNILNQMAQITVGPLSVLNNYIATKQRIHVVVRKLKGIKGYVEGVLQCFDRYFNLLLTDVEECYRQRKTCWAEQKIVHKQVAEDCSLRLKALNITLPTTTVKNLNRKNIEVKRKIPQLLLRGEHVVLISNLPVNKQKRIIL